MATEGRGGMRVRFLRDWRWNPPERNNQATIKYKAGTTMTVRRIAGEAAVAAGAAQEVSKEAPKKITDAGQ